MEGTVRPGSIVVGLDTSSAAMVALDWATEQARATHAPMILVHGFSPDNPALAFGMGADEASLRVAGETVLVRGRNRVHGVDDTIEVATSHPDGYPSAALVRASRGARMVVVGSHGDSLLHISSLGETAFQIAAHAECPVAVVRHGVGSDDTYGRITVGVDGSTGSHRALEWAFVEAERTEAELVALHAWQPKDARDPSLAAGDWNSYADRCEALIEDALTPQRVQHPEVKVRAEIVQGNPTRALIAASQASDAVAIGARGVGGFEGLRLGRVSSGVLAHAGATVVVAR